MIEIKNLSKTFHTSGGDVEALKDIDLRIEDGDIFGIIGLSGAGKSTLVRCMNLLEVPSEGRVLVDGKELTALPPRELRKARQSISMIFQGFNLLMQRTALDNIQGRGLPGAALRRPEAAGGHRPGPGLQSPGPPLR